MSEIALYLAAALLLLGAAFGLVAAIGVLRLPDLYTRLHAASKAGLMGGGLMLLAVAIGMGDGPVALRAILGIIFLFLSTPIAAHLLARAALKAGDQPVASTNIDTDLNG